MLSAWSFRLKSRKTELLCILVPDCSSAALLLVVFPWHKNQKENILAYSIPITSQNQLLFTKYSLHKSVNINAEK